MRTQANYYEDTYIDAERTEGHPHTFIFCGTYTLRN